MSLFEAFIFGVVVMRGSLTDGLGVFEVEISIVSLEKILISRTLTITYQNLKMKSIEALTQSHDLPRYPRKSGEGHKTEASPDPVRQKSKTNGPQQKL